MLVTSSPGLLHNRRDVRLLEISGKATVFRDVWLEMAARVRIILRLAPWNARCWFSGTKDVVWILDTKIAHDVTSHISQISRNSAVYTMLLYTLSVLYHTVNLNPTSTDWRGLLAAGCCFTLLKSLNIACAHHVLYIKCRNRVKIFDSDPIRPDDPVTQFQLLLMRWLQLRFDFDCLSTVVRFEFDSTTVRRPSDKGH